MFWKTQIVESTSITDLLNKEGVQLEEVLDDEFILQELKVQNKRLIEFLSEAENILKLLRFATTMPPIGTEDRKRFRYAHLSSEVLTANVDEITRAMMISGESRRIITQFLHNQKPDELNPLLASFYTKIMTQLLAKESNEGELLNMLKESDFYVDSLIDHMGTSSVMDLCYRFVTVPEDEEGCTKIKEWLCEKQLVEKLVGLFDPIYDFDIHMNAANLWAELVRVLRDIQYTKLEKTSDPLLDSLQSRQSLSGLLSKMFQRNCEPSCSQSLIVNGCHIFSALLQTVFIPNSPRELAEKANSSNPPWRGGPPNGHPDFGKPAFAGMGQEDPNEIMWSPDPDHITEQCLAERLCDFHKYLRGSGDVKSMLLPMGEIERPLGPGRLAVVKLLAILLNTSHEKTLMEMSKLGTLKVLLDLVFAYPWNNFLHTAVNQCILCVLFLGAIRPPEEGSGDGSSPSLNPRSSGDSQPSPSSKRLDSTSRESVAASAGTGNNGGNYSWKLSDGGARLIKHLLMDCRLLDVIVQAKEKSDQNERKTEPYIGHIMQLSQLFENARLRGPNKSLLEQILKELPDSFKDRWEGFVEWVLVPYEKMNEPDNVDEPGTGGLAAIAGEDELQNWDDEMATVRPSGLEANQLFSDYQTQVMNEPLPDRFGLPMDTYTSKDKDDIIETLSKQTSSFQVQELDDITPPGEASFEALCNAKINTNWEDTAAFDEKSSDSRESSSSEGEDENMKDITMDVDDPWAKLDERLAPTMENNEKWANFGPAGPGWVADFDAFPPLSKASPKDPLMNDVTWTTISPVSQGLAVSTAFGFDWPTPAEAGVGVGQAIFGSPKKRERTRSGGEKSPRPADESLLSPQKIVNAKSSGSGQNEQKIK